jgi:beta-galactosidase
MKGLITYDRRTKKDAFYWYKANWSDDPFVHICSKRFVNRDASPILVKVYSNQQDVRLEVNGSDAGPGTRADHIFEWTVDLLRTETRVRAMAEGVVPDEATFVRVDVADESYICPQPAAFGAGRLQRQSWYEKEGLTADPSLYSTWTAVGELLENPYTRAVLVDVLGADFVGGRNDARWERGAAFSLDFLAGFLPDVLTDERMRELHTRLSVIPKT